MKYRAVYIIDPREKKIKRALDPDELKNINVGESKDIIVECLLTVLNFDICRMMHYPEELTEREATKIVHDVLEKALGTTILLD